MESEGLSNFETIDRGSMQPDSEKLPLSEFGKQYRTFSLKFYS